MQTKIIIQRLSEVPTAPTTIGTMAWNETGDWRYVTPARRRQARALQPELSGGHPDPALSGCREPWGHRRRSRPAADP